MRSLLTNLRRIAAGAERQQSRYTDLIRLAGWFDSADDERAHEIWAAAFGLYSARHLSFAADPDGDPVPATQSWWMAPVAEVPIGLRTYGERKAGGRAGARVDYSAAKQARLAERELEQRCNTEAMRELASHPGPLREARLSDDARAALLDLYAQALSRHSRPLSTETPTWSEARIDDTVLRLELRAAPGTSVSIKSPSGVLTLRDLAIDLTTTSAERRSAAMGERRADA
jgi:uncharacterized protein (TIGR02677 family)